MDFSSNDSEPTAVEDKHDVVTDRRYAVDEDDNAFVHVLVSATERCIAYSSVVREEEDQRKYVRQGQSHMDFLNNKYQRYTGCDVTPIDDYVTERARDLEEDADNFQAQKEKLMRCVERTRSCAIGRERELSRLYAASQRFINRYGLLGEHVAPGIGFNFDFCKYLANFTAFAALSKQGQTTLVNVRKQVLDSRIAAPGESRSTFTKKRKQALASYRERQVEVEMQRLNRLDSEQQFFLGVVQPLLQEAGILPDRRGSASSSSSGDLSRVDQTTTEHTQTGPSNLQAVQDEPPELRNVLDRKAALAKAVAALSTLRESYASSLGEYLITFSGWNKARFDDRWASGSGGQRYSAQSAEAKATVAAAEAAYQQSYWEAEEAGVTPLPPSPRDTGNRSRDGETDSEHEESEVNKRRARSKRRPETRAWIKRVAKSGRPLSPFSDPQRPTTSISKRPRGIAKPNWGFMEGGVSRRSRIDRHSRHQDVMRRRYEAQEEERARISTGAAAPTPPPTPAPVPETWTAAVWRRCEMM